jgi:pilus assembly protein CpaF
MNWEAILPFLLPLECFLRDPEVSDILINGPGRIFIERRGRLEPVRGIEISETYLQIAIRNIARLLGSDVSAEIPILHGRLPDGSRVTAVLAPCAVSGTALAIRKCQGQRLSPEDIVNQGTLSAAAMSDLRKAVENHENILISGATGTGKTTLLNALTSFIDPDERTVIIEDTAEIQMAADDVVRLEARPEQPSQPAITMRDLLKATLRLRPDRILLGEVRGGEAFDLLQAISSGHSGSLSTLHASSAPRALSKFATYVLQSGINLPYRAIRSQIADGLNVLVHLKRKKGSRYVSEIRRVLSYDAEQDHYEFETIYEHP